MFGTDEHSWVAGHTQEMESSAFTLQAASWRHLTIAHGSMKNTKKEELKEDNQGTYGMYTP